MKTSRMIQFAIAALLVSAGCGILLSDAPAGFAVICFCLPSFVLLRRAEMSRPMPARELWISVGVLVVLVAFIVLANRFIPRSSSEHFVRRPVVIGTLWMLTMAALFWRWTRERRSINA
jgi:hypothetical protein